MGDVPQPLLQIRPFSYRPRSKSVAPSKAKKFTLEPEQTLRPRLTGELTIRTSNELHENTTCTHGSSTSCRKLDALH
jgi:hypothetical protein